MTTVPSVALKVIQMTTIAPSVVLIKSRDESRYEIHDNEIVSVQTD